jgi:hypothetical protein
MVFDVGTHIEVTSGADICSDNYTINGTYSGDGTLCEGALPVELSSFTASVKEKSVHLFWKTETEVGNYGFDVERSGIKGDWKMIAFIEGHGNSNSPNSYSYVDKNPIGGFKFKYRLKQIDTDGKFEYSEELEVELVPTEYALYQNYPNPFNPITTIKYQIPELSFVTLKVFDVLGNEIVTLVNEDKPAGSYEVEFNATSLPSGICFYKLQAGDYVETKKMVLMK